MSGFVYPPSGGGGGSVDRIQSTDTTTLTVAHPTGPTVTLTATGGASIFPTKHGTVTPVSAVTGTRGDTYLNTATGTIGIYVSTAPGNTAWALIDTSVTDAISIQLGTSRLTVTSSSLTGAATGTVEFTARTPGTAGKGSSVTLNRDGKISIATASHATDLYVYDGDPNGHVTATIAGNVCIDTATPAIWLATASGTTSWVQVGAPSSDYLFGSGATGTFTAQNARTATLTFTKGSRVVTSTDADFVDSDLGQLIVTATRSYKITTVTSGMQVTTDTMFIGTTATVAATIGGWIPALGNFVNLTIPEGVTTRVACTYPFITGNGYGIAAYRRTGFVFFCTGTFTIDGTLDLSGQDASGKTPPTLLVLGPTNLTPRAGSTGPGTPTVFRIWRLNGGNGGSTAVNAGGVFAHEPTASVTNPTIMLGFLSATTQIFTLAPAGGLAGAGGGLTATVSLGTGGAGGGPGVFGIIVARHIVHGETNSYNLQGGNGGNGTGTNAGGGGGGAAGWWMTLSDTLTGTANITGTGGAGGSGVGTGGNGTAGTDGFSVHYLTGTAGPV